MSELRELLEHHLKGRFLLAKRDLSAGEWLNVLSSSLLPGAGLGPIAILRIVGLRVEVYDPRISIRELKFPFYEDKTIDFHNPDSFNLLDRFLGELRELFEARLCASA